MAGQTLRVAVGDRSRRLAAEGDERAALFSARFRMLLGRTMAALAAERLVFGSRLAQHDLAHGAGGELRACLLVTFDARRTARVSSAAHGRGVVIHSRLCAPGHWHEREGDE